VDWSIRQWSSSARKRRTAQRQIELSGVHQTLRAGARQTELGLRELTLRVDHVNDAGIAERETAASKVERRHGCADRFLLGAKLVGIVGEGLQLVRDLAKGGEDGLPVGREGGIVAIDCGPPLRAELAAVEDRLQQPGGHAPGGGERSAER
jgi:hypothetical protein